MEVKLDLLFKDSTEDGWKNSRGKARIRVVANDRNFVSVITNEGLM
jgi:hypothetical protein